MILKLILICIVPLIAIGLIDHFDNWYRDKKKKQLHQELRNKNAAWQAQQEHIK